MGKSHRKINEKVKTRARCVHGSRTLRQGYPKRTEGIWGEGRIAWPPNPTGSVSPKPEEKDLLENST